MRNLLPAAMVVPFAVGCIGGAKSFSTTVFGRQSYTTIPVPAEYAIVDAGYEDMKAIARERCRSMPAEEAVSIVATFLKTRSTVDPESVRVDATSMTWEEAESRERHSVYLAGIREIQFFYPLFGRTEMVIHASGGTWRYQTGGVDHHYVVLALARLIDGGSSYTELAP